MSDESLREAFRALRERHDGTHPEEDATLRRALRATQKRARTRSMTRWIVLPAAAVLFASTAWAGATGHLRTAVHAVIDALYAEHDGREGAASSVPSKTADPTPTPPATEQPAATIAPVASVAPREEANASPPPVPSPSPATPAVATPAPAPTPAPSALPSEAIPQPLATSAISSPPPVGAPPRPSATPTDPNEALFAEAYRIHFVDKNATGALGAWDRYLAAAPNGRFAPEAHYNRALALVRLGRSAEATRELQPFADGAYGEYRRADARALLEALARDR